MIIGICVPRLERPSAEIRIQNRPRLRRIPLACLLASLLPAAAQVSPPLAAGNDPAPLRDQPPLRIEVKELLIPVVVRDAHANEVQDLTQADFQVFDNGKLEPITAFSTLHLGNSQHPGQPASQPAGASVSPAPLPGSPARSVVFLFDDRHLSPTNLIEVQKAAIPMLDRSLLPSDRAVVLSFFGTNSGITSDHAGLAAAIQKIKARQMLPDPGRCPDIDYYSADQILNKHSDTQYQIEIEKAANCSHKSSKADAGFVETLVRAAADQSLLAGDQDAIDTLSYIRDVLHSMDRLPGQRVLILISPGFLNYSGHAMRIASQVLNMAASSNVMVSALDARGLGSAMLEADQAGSGSVFSQIAGQTPGNAHQSAEENDDVMAELAAGTGGAFVRGSGDLAGEFVRVTTAPETTYLLGISLQGLKPNGSYHQLRIKVNRDKVTIQSRRGYFAPKATK